ncbi:protein tesmin/TSO1-like CXC 5 isoform X2 [Malania oleifera]|nr:protein tesmin/TSO1-like CXC 5 isoform X2 [Malania oleifera]
MTEQSEQATDFPAKKLVRQLDFTATCRASANVKVPEHSESQLRLQSKSQCVPEPQQQSESQPQVVPVMVQRSRHPLLPRPALPLPVVKPETQRVQPGCNAEDCTPKKQKQCNCKNSKCLKLYCECFASGTYCDACNCINCHNNVENEAARQEAVGATLERNPNAFRPKIANSPHGSQDGKEEAREVSMLGRHNKGCNCKKSGCLKKYCECFQGNILCSENCKCMDCKNFEASEERRALFCGDHGNAIACIQQAANAAINGAIGSSGYGTPPSSKKRKAQEGFVSTSANKQSSIHRIFQFQQESHLRASAASSPVAALVSHTSSTAVLGSSKLAYRSPLAGILQPQDIRELCSLLVVGSKETTMAFRDKKRTGKRGERDEDRKSIASSPEESKDIQKEDDVRKAVCDDRLNGPSADGVQAGNSGLAKSDVQCGRPLSPGTLSLMCDEQDTILMMAASPNGVVRRSQNTTLKSSPGEGLTDAYADQERLVLTRFRDFLDRLITCASIKEAKYANPEMVGQREHSENGNVKAEDGTRGSCSGVVKSLVPVSAEMSKAIPAVSFLSSDGNGCPAKVGSPRENGKIKMPIKK